MKREFVLGVAALVASCVFAQDVFAQRSGSRGLGEAGFRTAAPGYIGRPKLRVVVRPGLRCAGRPRLCYYAGSDLPYVPVGTPPFFLAGHAGKIDSLLGLGRVPVAEHLRKILPLEAGAPQPTALRGVGRARPALFLVSQWTVRSVRIRCGCPSSSSGGTLHNNCPASAGHFLCERGYQTGEWLCGSGPVLGDTGSFRG